MPNGEVKLTAYPCGHTGIETPKIEHPLCVACDSRVLFLSGLTDEERRYNLWLIDITVHRARCRCVRCNELWGEMFKGEDH